MSEEEEALSSHGCCAMSQNNEIKNVEQEEKALAGKLGSSQICIVEALNCAGLLWELGWSRCELDKKKHLTSHAA